MNHEVYEQGKFAEKIDIAINKKKEIKEIIQNISGRELPLGLVSLTLLLVRMVAWMS